MGKNVEEGKNILLKGIKKEKEEYIKEYDQYYKEIEQEDNIARMYEKIIDIYKHNREQRPTSIAFLRTVLEHPFFVGAEDVTKSGGWVGFKNEEYAIYFPTSRQKLIRIEDLKVGQPSHSSVKTEEDYQELTGKLKKRIEIAETYRENKTLENMRKLNENNSDYRTKERTILGKARRFYTLDRYYSVERIEQLKNNVKRIKENYKRYKESKKKYDLKKEETRNFVDTIQDLKVFEDAGYDIQIRIG